MGNGSVGWRTEVTLHEYDISARRSYYNVVLAQLIKDFHQRWEKSPGWTAKARLSDFTVLHLIGRGKFGNVILVKHNYTQTYLAMKVINKMVTVKRGHVDRVLEEMRILYCIRFPFIVNIEYAFHDRCNVYLVLSYLSGGDFFSHLRSGHCQCPCVPEQVACFYATQILLAFEYLHELNIIYRDLKPENTMISHDGYLILVDFGSAKMVNGRTYTLCGTPEYIAPEMLMSKGYSRGVDWWAFGVFIYEMVASYPPFYGDTQMEVFEHITEGSYRMPSDFSAELAHLVKNLLRVDVTKRYGMMKNGIGDIKRHPFFNGINLSDIYHKRVQAPTRPTNLGPGDISNFPLARQNIPPTIIYTEEYYEYYDAFGHF